MKKIILSLSILSLTVLGCKKDNIHPITNGSIPTDVENPLKIKSAFFISNTFVPISKMDTTTTTSSDTFTIYNEFNSSGKIVSGGIRSGKTNGFKIDSKYTVSYSDVNKVIITNNLNNKTIFNLNSLGNAWLVNEVDTIFYDKDGFLSQERNLFDRKKVVTKVVDGNITELGTTKFEYYTDKINQIGQFNLSHFFDQTSMIPLPIFGKSSKNLVKRITDNEGGVINFSYEYDSKNRVHKRICFYSDGPGGEHDFKTILTLTYQE